MHDVAEQTWESIIRAGPDALRPLVPLDVSKVWTPHPGPQAAFMVNDAYELLYGGAAGGGKTDALMYRNLHQAHLPKARALFLRESFPSLREVMDRAQQTFPSLGGVWNEQRKRFAWPNGFTYEFGFVESYKDVLAYTGQEYSDIAVDEAGLMAHEKIWTFLISRNRCPDPRVGTYMRASANPGGAGHAWLKRRFVSVCPPDGTIIEIQSAVPGTPPTTRAFIPARLADNPTLEKGDPKYRAKLRMLSEVQRRQLEEGDWTAGEGLALAGLNKAIHICDPFEVPKGWYQWGSFDWGFNHPWWFGHFAADPDGNAYLVNSLWGRRDLPHEIADTIADLVPVKELRKIHAGHDCWAEVRSRSEYGRSIADQLAEKGVYITQATISRIQGLNNMRDYVDYKADDLAHYPPRFKLMRTETNETVFECLESMVTDPKRPEDALKVDADELGMGGDDAYDMVRYGLAARPLKGVREADEHHFSAFSPEALQGDREKRKISLKKEKDRKAQDDSFDSFDSGL